MTWRLSKARRVPTAFRRWCAENQPLTERVWEDLAAEAKDAIRARMRRDQRGLCAYCYVGLRDETIIEHIDAQTPDNRFVWTNLALCCPGHTHGERHCDQAKGNIPLEFLHPYQQPVLRHVRLRRDGRLVPTEEARADVERTLRLNTRALQRKREQACRAITADLSARGPARRWSVGDLKRATEELASRDDALDFQPLLMGWLQRQLGSRG